MDVEKLKKSVLVDLRSVIQSCKGGVPLNRLQNDYKFLVGATIPFISLGYNSLEAFLQSIHQFIKLKKNNEGQVIVEAVADSSTVHLQNIISKQKSTKTQKCSVKRYGSRSAPKPKSSFCSNCSSSKNAFNISNGMNSSASSSWSIASEASNDKDKEIKSLKSKLAEQTDLNATLKSKVNQLISESEPNLEDEQIMIQRMKYQIGILQKRILLRHSASSDSLKVNRNINEIAERINELGIAVEKLSPHLTKVTSPVAPAENVPVSSSKLHQQQCKEMEELKKQLQLQSSQLQRIENRMQSQLQKLENRIKTESPVTPSIEQLKLKLVEDVVLHLENQNLQVQNFEKYIESEILQLKTRVEKEYFIQLAIQSDKLKDFEKQLKGQQSRFQKSECQLELKYQKLKNNVDKINFGNVANALVKQLITAGLISKSQLLSSSSHSPPSQQTAPIPSCPSSSQTAGATKSRKKKKKSSATSASTISAAMSDHCK